MSPRTQVRVFKAPSTNVLRSFSWQAPRKSGRSKTVFLCCMHACRYGQIAFLAAKAARPERAMGKDLFWKTFCFTQNFVQILCLPLNLQQNHFSTQAKCIQRSVGFAAPVHRPRTCDVPSPKKTFLGAMLWANTWDWNSIRKKHS